MGRGEVWRLVLDSDDGPRFEEVPHQLPVLYRDRPRRTERLPSADPLWVLLKAFESLTHRGPGWGPHLGSDPIAFLLDAVSNPVLLRAEGGEVVFKNRAAEDLGPVSWPPDEYEHRVMKYASPVGTVYIEILVGH